MCACCCFCIKLSLLTSQGTKAVEGDDSSSSESLEDAAIVRYVKYVFSTFTKV